MTVSDETVPSRFSIKRRFIYGIFNGTCPGKSRGRIEKNSNQPCRAITPRNFLAKIIPRHRGPPDENRKSSLRSESFLLRTRLILISIFRLFSSVTESSDRKFLSIVSHTFQNGDTFRRYRSNSEEWFLIRMVLKQGRLLVVFFSFSSFFFFSTRREIPHF